MEKNYIAKKFINDLNEIENIITNMDLDGILSSGILFKLFPNKFKLSGFNNSTTSNYVKDGIGVSNTLFIDYYCKNKKIMTIDQHIIDIDNFTDNSSRKYNPNRDRNRTLDAYRYANSPCGGKYPYSTFIYLIMLLENNGYVLNIDIDKKIGSVIINGKEEDVYIWELLLRADGSLYSCFNFEGSPWEWFEWLKKYSNENGLIKKLYDKCNELYNNTWDKSKEQIKIYHNKIVEFFNQNGFYNLGSDGSSDILNEYFVNLQTFIFKEIFDIYININIDEYVFKGTINLRCDYNGLTNDFKKIARNMINENVVTSYAFVRSKKLSLTVKNENNAEYIINKYSKYFPNNIKKVTFDYNLIR